MDFDSRYKKLNAAQKQAVDTIDGPLMVVAGPGTGKTELLSMRAANILRQTDTLPSNILCLTFTESGAAAMRERLTQIIGPDAYKVAIHTFHSFGSEIISRYSEYFYNGARFQPASEVETYELLLEIFESLDHSNPLSGTMNGEYTYLRDTITTISELKRSGLTSDELLKILDDNERVLDAVEGNLADVFASRISKSTKDNLTPIAVQAASLPLMPLPPTTTPLYEPLALSLSHAIDEAEDTESTKPITAWRNKWMEKNSAGDFVFKDRKRIERLRAVGYIYHRYLSEMRERMLYDFDDMVLEVVHALEVVPELCFNLQEQYLYIMVDEFQDTNQAQSRLLESLTNNPASEGAPNVMVVGDDDQAIYRFQGAEISNIMRFKDRYETCELIVLTENYRSTKPVLEHAREVISQGMERLERFMPEINKSLNANISHQETSVSLTEASTIHTERQFVAESIAAKIKAGTAPESITVIARRHHELVSLLPYLADADVSVNYERRENVLESPIVQTLELLTRVVTLIAGKRHSDADALLPELLAHPAWGIDADAIWKMSLEANRQHITWMEYMKTAPHLKQLQAWLVDAAKRSLITPLEPMLDYLLGSPSAEHDESYRSPLYDYYFAENKLDESPETYVELLTALTAIRDKLREHSDKAEHKLPEFLEFLELQRTLGASITRVISRSETSQGRIQLMTAHKSKGLEFEHVYIIGAIDGSWGQTVRTRSRLISYPENLQIAPVGDTFDERLRLFFVAMTRAKHTLSISYSKTNDSGASLDKASFLVGSTLQSIEAAHDAVFGEKEAQLAWYTPLIEIRPPTARELLASRLDRYALSATHLNTFIDVTRGGPAAFLMNNLLRFPQAMSANAAYGSAIHRTLQQAHTHLIATGNRRPIEDILSDFETNMSRAQLDDAEKEQFTKRGLDHLETYFALRYDSFTAAQRAELDFARQSSIVGDAHLTGSLDLVDIDTKQRRMTVTDYKTGKAALSWKGKSDAEKIKLHKYRQQLLFYKLLVEHSREFGDYTVDQAILEFVEPSPAGDIVQLAIDFDEEELERFSRLIQAVWKRIIHFDLPNVSHYGDKYQDILAFERFLLGEDDA